MSKIPFTVSASDDKSHGQDQENHDGEEHSPHNTVGVAIPPTTLSHDVCRHHLGEAKRTFNVEFPVVQDPDPQLGSNMLRVLDTMPKMKPDMQARLIELTNYCSSIIQLMSVAGTGMTLRKEADLRELLPPVIDILVQGNELHVGERADEAHPAKRLMLAAMNYPRMDPGSILLDHRVGAVGYGKVTSELADLLVATTFLDIVNFQDRYHTASYETIPVGGMDQAQVSQVVQNRARQTELWFSPEVWAPWDDQQEVPTAGPRQVVALLPNEFDRINGGDIQLLPIQANVEEAHLLALQPLSTEWVTEILKEESITFLESKILGSESTHIEHIWRNQCRAYGFNDPEARFRQFRDNHLRE